jgi:hypothetical protein
MSIKFQPTKLRQIFSNDKKSLCFVLENFAPIVTLLSSDEKQLSSEDKTLPTEDKNLKQSLKKKSY